MAEEYRGTVTFVGISDDRDTVEDGRAYAASFDVPYPLGLKDEVWDLYGVPYQPVTVVLDGRGVEVHRVTGPVLYDALKAEIEKAL